MWIRVVEYAPMQACAESGHFCTVGILILDKFFLENQFPCSKKNPASALFISNSNRARVFTFLCFVTIDSGCFFIPRCCKAFAEKNYSFIPSTKKITKEKNRKFSFERGVRNSIVGNKTGILLSIIYFLSRNPNNWFY